MSVKRLILNFALFQSAWFCAVLAPPHWDIAGATTALALHLRLLAVPREWQLLAVVAAVGAALDSTLAATGVFRFANDSALIPLWLLLIWCNFGATLCHSLQWLQQHKIIAAALGGIAGPACYLGGAALTDKLIINAPTPVFILISATCWALLCLALPWAAARLCSPANPTNPTNLTK